MMFQCFDTWRAILRAGFRVSGFGYRGNGLRQRKTAIFEPSIERGAELPELSDGECRAAAGEFQNGSCQNSMKMSPALTR